MVSGHPNRYRLAGGRAGGGGSEELGCGLVAWSAACQKQCRTRKPPHLSPLSSSGREPATAGHGYRQVPLSTQKGRNYVGCSERTGTSILELLGGAAEAHIVHRGRVHR